MFTISKLNFFVQSVSRLFQGEYDLILTINRNEFVRVSQVENADT